MDDGTIFAIIVISIYFLIRWIIESKKEPTTISPEQAAKENISGSSDYIYKVNERPSLLGGTNLDRFFIECVLAGCEDFSIKKNVEKATLLAKKYNLSIDTDVASLFEKGKEAHRKVSTDLNEKRLFEIRKKEREEADELNRYVYFRGKEKRIRMLTDSKNKLLNRAKELDEFSRKMSQGVARQSQKELNWASWGGAASAIGGTGLAIETVRQVEQKNSQIRAQNESMIRSTLPTTMKALTSASDCRRRAEEIQKQIELFNEKMLGDQSTDEIMKHLSISNTSLEISETGAFKVSAMVTVNEPLYIFGDVPALADGTFIAHVMEGEQEVGKAYMILPVDGVTTRTGIVGIGDGCKLGNTYSINITPYHLCAIEQ